MVNYFPIKTVRNTINDPRKIGIVLGIFALKVSYIGNSVTIVHYLIMHWFWLRTTVGCREMTA